MLMSLLKPEKWNTNKVEEFEVQLLDWELDIQRYEQQSAKVFDDDHKVATVLRWSPPDVRNSLMAGDPGNRDSYAKMRSAILTLLRGRTTYNSQGMPQGDASPQSDAMQIDQAKGREAKEIT